MTSYPHIDDIYSRLRTTYNDGITFPLEYRRKQLRQLALLVQENTDELCAALQADLNKPKLEAVLTELLPIVNSCRTAIEKLDEWATPEKPEVPEWRKSFDISIHPVPKGVALTISPWNYPIVISLNPLIGAIAAGCSAVVKPSEVSANAANALARLFPKYLDPNAYAVVLGAKPETTYLLSLKWDFILFTGGCAIGKIVASAAAENTTPCALELGGTSPVVVADDANIDLAAKRILWGKKQNSGQLCVSPNHVLIPRHLQDKFVTAIKSNYSTYFPNGTLGTPDMSKIISENHHKRVLNLLASSKGQKILGGGHNEDSIELTVLKDVPVDDPLVKEEIFGPILPIVPVESVNEAYNIIRKNPSPLVTYLFTNQQELKGKFLRGVRCGSLIQNDCVQQLDVPELPFGGVGESGYGAYCGKHSFDMFTHRKSFMNVPSEVEPMLEPRYPPYKLSSLSIFEAALRAPFKSTGDESIARL